MTNRGINALLWIGLIGILVIGTSFVTDVYRAFWEDHSIWWTPVAMRVPIEKTKGNFELYIGGEPLQKHLSNGTLFSVDKNGTRYPVVSKDITVRLNNWDEVRASILTHTTMSGFASGVALTLFVIGLIQAFQHRKKLR